MRRRFERAPFPDAACGRERATHELKRVDVQTGDGLSVTATNAHNPTSAGSNVVRRGLNCVSAPHATAERASEWPRASAREVQYRCGVRFFRGGAASGWAGPFWGGGWKTDDGSAAQPFRLLMIQKRPFPHCAGRPQRRCSPRRFCCGGSGWTASAAQSFWRMRGGAWALGKSRRGAASQPSLGIARHAMRGLRRRLRARPWRCGPSPNVFYRAGSPSAARSTA